MDEVIKTTIRKMSPQFLVTDLNRSIKFYSDILGFETDFLHSDFYAGIIKDGHSIHLKIGEPLLKDRKNKTKNNDLDIVFTVEGIEELFEVLSEKSIKIIQPLRKMPYGKEFYVADPDGYILCFIEEVSG